MGIITVTGTPNEIWVEFKRVLGGFTEPESLIIFVDPILCYSVRRNFVGSTFYRSL